MAKISGNFRQIHFDMTIPIVQKEHDGLVCDDGNEVVIKKPDDYFGYGIQEKHFSVCAIGQDDTNIKK